MIGFKLKTDPITDAAAFVFQFIIIKFITFFNP